MKRVTSFLLVFLMVACLFVGCSSDTGSNSGADSKEAVSGESTGTSSEGSSSGVTNLTVVRPGDQDKVASFMEPAIKKFNKENPDIHVSIKYVSWSGWIQTYATYFQAGTQPDVVFWWDNKLFDSSAHDHLVNLKPYLSNDFLKQIPDRVWKLVDIGSTDGLYYIPSSVDTFALYYNKNVFKQAGLDPESPPTTWNDLLADAKAIHEKTGLPGIGVPAMTGSEVLEEFVGVFLNQSTNAPILDSKSTPLFNNDKGMKALNFLQTLWPYAQSSPTQYGRGELRPLLRDSKIGMLIDGPWAIPTFTAAFGQDLDKSIIGIAHMPVPEKGTKIDWAGTNGWIATRQKTAKASAKLIEYLMSPEVLESHHIAYGSAPLYESEFNNKAFQYDYWKVFYDESVNWTTYGMIGKNSPTPDAYYTAMEKVWQQFLLGQINAQQAMTGATAAAKSVTARN